LNDARYLKIGQSLWVDRTFSKAVLNAMYSFHASAAAYEEFWNNTFAHSFALSRRHIWAAFIQESIRMVASSSNTNLSLQDALNIEEVTTQAFAAIGENGIIRSANSHQCSECTHAYKSTADIITGNDPAALVGVDEHQDVPVLRGPDAALATRDAAMARQAALHAQMNQTEDAEVSDEHAPVRMVVIDGIVVGHSVGLLSSCHSNC
jgi:hypothetical protein